MAPEPGSVYFNIHRQRVEDCGEMNKNQENDNPAVLSPDEYFESLPSAHAIAYDRPLPSSRIPSGP